MIPGNLTLTLYQGDDFSLIFRMKDSVSGNYVNLGLPGERTGRGQIRASANEAEVLDEFLVTILDQTTVPGGVMISLTPAQTAALPLEGGVYDIEIANQNRSWVRTPIAGSIVVLAEVTR